MSDNSRDKFRTIRTYIQSILASNSEATKELKAKIKELDSIPNGQIKDMIKELDSIPNGQIKDMIKELDSIPNGQIKDKIRELKAKIEEPDIEENNALRKEDLIGIRDRSSALQETMFKDIGLR